MPDCIFNKRLQKHGRHFDIFQVYSLIYIKKKINNRPAGPDDEQRSKAISLVWGQVTNAAGKTETMRLKGPEGYTLTTLSSLLITQKILQSNFIPGYQTPASAYGENLVMEIPGVEMKN